MGDFNEMATCLLKQQLHQRKRRIKLRLLQSTAACVLGLTLGLGNGLWELHTPVGQVSKDLCLNTPCVEFEYPSR